MSLPDETEIEQLTYELESSEVARRLCAAELLRLRSLAAYCRANRRSLPPRIQRAIDEQGQPPTRLPRGVELANEDPRP